MTYTLILQFIDKKVNRKIKKRHTSLLKWSLILCVKIFKLMNRLQAVVPVEANLYWKK